MSRGEAVGRAVTVAVVADSSAAASQITSALRESGHLARQLPSLNPSPGAFLRDLRPSALVLRVAGAKHPESAALARIMGRDGMPVVLLTPTASPESLGLAADSGALIHLVEPVTSHALAAAVRLAVARAEDLRAAAQMLGKLRESAAIREVVERAKAILMHRFGFGEEEAHRRLQTESRTRNRKLAETAWHVIQADAQLGPRRRRRVAPSR